jgi:predicted transcriptional regulator/transcriptional regulator with XRE-family HTH domain
VSKGSLRVGGKLRKLRQERRLSQVQMAELIGISPSYLNLLESNQRPVTARILIQFAKQFQVDLSHLAADSTEQITTELMELFADPLFETAEVKASDVRDLATTLPSVAKAVIDLYSAWRQHAGARSVQAGTDEPASGVASEEVMDFIQHANNHFPSLEEAAERFWTEQGLSLHNLQQNLAEALAQRFAVSVEIAPFLPGAQTLLRAYDPISRRLILSELLPLPSRTFQMAHQIAYLVARNELDRLAGAGKFTSPEADALAKSALANYFAAAVMMPYETFRKAAQGTRYDIDVLQARFGASFEQVRHRLTTLRRPGAEGIPFHLVRVDVAGNISKRFSASGIHIARFGAACPRWNVYDAFGTPGMLRLQVSRMPDGATFFCMARTVRPAGRSAVRLGLSQRTSQLAIGIGCHVRHARDIGYSDGLHLEDAQIITPIGVSCRACPRADCTDRAFPWAGQRLQIDENKRGLSAYVTP